MNALYERMSNPTCVVRMLVLIHAGMSFTGAALAPDSVIGMIYEAAGTTGDIAAVLFGLAWIALAVHFVFVDILGRKSRRLHHWRWLPKFVIAAIYTLFITTALSLHTPHVTVPFTIGYMLFSLALFWVCIVIVRRQHVRALEAVATGPGAL